MTNINFRSITHDYEAVHNSTETEDGGVFKNFNYMEPETKAQMTSYTEIMRNNEELLASHMATMTSTSREVVTSEMDTDNDTDTNHLVSTTHTSQVTCHVVVFCKIFAIW